MCMFVHIYEHHLLNFKSLNRSFKFFDVLLSESDSIKIVIMNAQVWHCNISWHVSGPGSTFNAITFKCRSLL